MERCVPASACALAAHLVVTGHRYGECFYGCATQRTTVAVSRDDSAGGELRQEILPP